MLLLAFIVLKVNRVAPGIVRVCERERERKGRESHRERERESGIVIKVEHVHCLRTARLPATSSIDTQKPAKRGNLKGKRRQEKGSDPKKQSECEQASQGERGRERGRKRVEQKGSPC